MWAPPPHWGFDTRPQLGANPQSHPGLNSKSTKHWSKPKPCFSKGGKYKRNRKIYTQGLGLKQRENPHNRVHRFMFLGLQSMQQNQPFLFCIPSFCVFYILFKTKEGLFSYSFPSLTLYLTLSLSLSALSLSLSLSKFVSLFAKTEMLHLKAPGMQHYSCENQTPCPYL